MRGPGGLCSEDYERPAWNGPRRQGRVGDLREQESYSMFSSNQCSFKLC